MRSSEVSTTGRICSHSDPEQQRIWKELYDNFCRHLVCLAVRYCQVDRNGQRESVERIAHYTFFIVSVGERWFLITSGHVLKEIEGRVRNPRIRIEYFMLADFFGEREAVKVPTPFSFDPEESFYEDNNQLGLDFGFIPLRAWYVTGLRANGIIPITEQYWTRPHDPPITAYFMLGFPQDLNLARNLPTKPGDERNASATPVLVSVERVDDPATLPDSVPTRETTFPRFIGRITAAEIEFRVEGMSGGPIFGLVDVGSSAAYTVVAMQNSWHAPTRTLFGCPIRVFGAILTAYLENETKSA